MSNGVIGKNETTYSGYLGWYLNIELKEYINENYTTLSDIKKKLKNPEIIKQLELLFNISQEFLINPIMSILLEKSDEMFQNQMNRYLNLDKLEVKTKGLKGFITRELYMRLVEQNLMEHYKKKNHTYYKTISQNVYIPDEFSEPKPKYSRIHTKCLEQLERFIAKIKSNDKYEIINEYQYKLPNYDKPARADILVKKNGECYWIIEADGDQHYEYTPHFHRDILNKEGETIKTGEQVFKKLQLKDKEKDKKAQELCNGKECLRIKDNENKKDIYSKISNLFYT